MEYGWSQSRMIPCIKQHIYVHILHTMIESRRNDIYIFTLHREPTNVFSQAYDWTVRLLSLIRRRLADEHAMWRQKSFSPAPRKDSQTKKKRIKEGQN